MPYPSEHALRLMDPGTAHERVRRTSGSGDAMVRGVKIPDTIDVIWYIIRREGKEVPTAQALRFPVKNWTEEKARAWIKKNNLSGSFEAASGAEKERAFCLGCGTVIELKHGTAEEHECAECGGEMYPLRNKTVNLKPINVFRTGKWKGFDYTVKHLDEMVRNFRQGIIRPYLKLTEDGSHGSVQRPLLSSLAFGWIDGLLRKGERLYASFKQVPEAIAKLITGGALKQKSIEVWPNFHTTDGKKRGAALEAVLFFGTGLPAVHDLEEAAEMYTVSDGGEKHEIVVDEMTSHDPGGTGTGEPNNNPGPSGGARSRGAGGKRRKQENRMDIDTVDFQALVADQAKLKVIEGQVKEQGDRIAKLQAELETAKGDVTKVTKERDEAVSVIVESKRANVEAFVSGLIKSGQLEPFRKDAVVTEILSRDEAKAEEYRKTLSNMPKLFKGDVSDDSVKNTEPKDDTNGEDPFDTEKRDEAIKAAMKADPKLTYTEAKEKLFGGGNVRIV